MAQGWCTGWCAVGVRVGVRVGVQIEVRGWVAAGRGLWCAWEVGVGGRCGGHPSRSIEKPSEFNAEVNSLTSRPPEPSVSHLWKAWGLSEIDTTRQCPLYGKSDEGGDVS